MNIMYTIDRDNTDDGAWFHAEITMTSGTNGDPYRLPVQTPVAVGAYITGSGHLDFTISSLAKIEAGTANWATWDGVAQINPAVTGFRMVRDAGTVYAEVCVKTTSPS